MDTETSATGVSGRAAFTHLMSLSISFKAPNTGPEVVLPAREEGHALLAGGGASPLPSPGGACEVKGMA